MGDRTPVWDTREHTEFLVDILAPSLTGLPTLARRTASFGVNFGRCRTPVLRAILEADRAGAAGDGALFLPVCFGVLPGIFFTFFNFLGSLFPKSPPVNVVHSPLSTIYYGFPSGFHLFSWTRHTYQYL